MKKRYDEGGYIPKSIFNQEGTPIADVGESRFMTESSPSEPESASESAPKAKKKPKAARKPKPKSEPMQSFIAPKKEMKLISSSEAKPRSKLDPYGVIEGAANKVKGAASDIGDALSKPFRAIREAGNRDNPDAPKKMAPGGKVTDKVDYEKDLHEYARTGTDKINKPVKKLEDLKMLKDAPEAAVKLVAALVGSPFASAASGAVNAYRDLPSGKKMRENLGSSYKKGGSISSASSRADGCATKGKTKGRFV